jgi:hypothetical protein
MSIGKIKRKDNPRVLKPISSAKAESEASKSIPTADQIKLQKLRERQAKQKQMKDAMNQIKSDMKSLLDGATQVTESVALVKVDTDESNSILKDIQDAFSSGSVKTKAELILARK